MQKLEDTQKNKAYSAKGKKRNPILPILLIVMGCGIFLFAAWSAVTSPVLASILNSSSGAKTQPTHTQLFAQVNIPKPSSAAQPVAPVNQPTAIPATVAVEDSPATATPGSPPIVVDILPTDIPTLEVSVLPDVAGTPVSADPATNAPPPESGQPGVISAEIVVDTPTPEYVEPTVAPYVPPAVSNGGARWIDVDLSQQRVYAYEGDTLMNSFLVSTGTWQTPTVTGEFKIWIKVRSQAMSGPGYYLPDVPYVMYFYKDYGLHGTYWHNNFGTPMSHGCINLTIPDSEWLYNFASVGTLVNVHY
ncbi:MAG: L,D-transpeptidase family protein [Chloroflexi bacterium]|nr:L,D-transpeptidase family protein [Chloroflexota bacterium]